MPPLTLESSLRRFTETFSVSAELTREGSTLIPGGYSRNSFNFGPHAVFVERGDGAHIDTVDGRRLLDLNNNFTVNVLGHSHPAITSALAAAIPDGFSFGNPSRAEARLARMLVERIPSVEKVQFSCSATESCMSAIRIARAATGRTRVAKFEGGYHGFSDGLHISAHTRPGLAGPDAEPRPVAESGGIPGSIVDDVVVLVQNDLETSERILRANADDIACLILELQSGAGGLLALDDDFVAGIRELTRELGIVLIFDETITLRAGVGGLQANYGVLPDLTVMGKIIGGGLPLGAVGGSADLMDVLQDGRASISGTHHGHRLALVAGAACLEQLDEAAFAKLNGDSARILRELNDWSRSRGSRFAVWGRGFSHLAYGMLAEPGQVVRSHRDYLTKVDATATHIVSLELAVRGFFPVHRGEFSLSLAMTDDDVRSFIECVEQIVEELEG